MEYLSGAVRREVTNEPNFGFMLTLRMGNRLPDGAIWAADNGCLTHPELFDLDRFLRFLDRRGPRETCRFAAAPDALCDWELTLKRSLPVLPILRREGWRAALVAQNGLTVEMTPWDEIDCLFIGGDPAWKESRAAVDLIRRARELGKQAHVGCVNTPERIVYAARAGATSVDGTRLKFGFNANWPLLREWVRCVNAQQSFSYLAA